MSTVSNVTEREAGVLLRAGIGAQLAARDLGAGLVGAQTRMAEKAHSLRDRAMGTSGAVIVVLIVLVAVIAAIAAIAIVGLFIYCKSKGYDGVSFYEKTSSGEYYRVGCYKN